MKNNRTMKNKKTRTKNCYPTNNENCKKDHESITKIFLKMRELKKMKIKKGSMLKTEKEPNSDEVRGRKREYMRNYFHKKCVKSFN